MFKPLIPSIPSIATVILFLAVTHADGPMRHFAESRYIYNHNLYKIAASIPANALNPAPFKVAAVKIPLPGRNPFYGKR
jgi:hypothetical protein